MRDRLSRWPLCLLLPGLILAWFNPGQSLALTAPEWSGSLKTLNIISEKDPTGAIPDSQLSSNRFRLELGWALNQHLRLEAALDHQLLWADPADLLELSTDGVNRRLDLETTWHHSDAWRSRLQLDHFNLRLTLNNLDAVIGRQAIGFGRIVIFSPLDIIAPFPPDALDTNVRPGVDAIQMSTYYDLNGQLGGAYVFGDVQRHNSWLLTWSDNRGGIDLLAIGGRLRKRPMFGFGLAGNLGTLGLKAEAAHYEGQRTNEPGGDLHHSFTIGALEAWYRFDNGLTLISQYLYNGAGSDNPAEYLNVAASAPVQEGLTALLGRSYLLVAPSYELHPLVTLNGLLIWNLDDDSVLIRPSLQFEPLDSLSLELFLTLHSGAHPTSSSSILFPIPRSEFGLRGASGGLFVTFYF